jgi:hypothetical protein
MKVVICQNAGLLGEVALGNKQRTERLVFICVISACRVGQITIGAKSPPLAHLEKGTQVKE